VFGKPSSAQDQNAFATTTAFSDKYGVKTLSELAAKCSGAATVLGGPPECPQRPKCQQGLVSTYNFNAGKFSSLDAGGPLTKTGLKQGTISVGLVFSSDGALAAG
jgi:osmoprotectant transport system substrate-binding protein